MAINKIKMKTCSRYEASVKVGGVIRKKRFLTLQEAKIWELAVRQAPAMAGQPCLMYSLACSQYIADCELRIASNTLREKKKHLREFASYIRKDCRLQDCAMDDVTLSMARAFSNGVMARSGAKTANRRIRTLKALWNWHKSELNGNPWQAVKPFPEEEFVKYVPSKDDVEKVFAAATQQERDILTVISYTGARLSEVLNLKWEDVLDGSIRLWTHKSRNGSKTSRLVPVGHTLRDVLTRLHPLSEGSPYVFVNPATHGPYRRNQPSICHMLKRLCREAGVREFGFHALRHYFASMLVSTNKVTLCDIQHMLGHQRATTTDTYLHSLCPPVDHLAGVIEEMNQPLKAS